MSLRGHVDGTLARVSFSLSLSVCLESNSKYTVHVNQAVIVLPGEGERKADLRGVETVPRVTLGRVIYVR